MAGVHGEHFYGVIDRVPGLCHVATKFYHFNFVPIVPMGTYLFLETVPAGHPMQARRIPLSAKSLLLGYFRGWVGLATIILFAICGIQATEVILDGQRDDAIRALVYGIAIVAYGAVWWAIIGSHKSWIVCWLAVLAATGGYFAWDESNPPPPKPDNPFKAPMPRRQRERDELPMFFLYANGCLFALTVLRTFDRAGRSRAYELGEILGMTEENMDAAWERATGRPDLPKPLEED